LSADSPLQHPPTRRLSSDGLLGSHFARMSFRRFDHVDPPVMSQEGLRRRRLSTHTSLPLNAQVVTASSSVVQGLENWTNLES
jgi:hypothetical protein